MRVIVLLLAALTAGVAARATIPPIKVDILDAAHKQQGRALIYPDFVELEDSAGAMKGAIGVVWANGRTQLFLVKADGAHSLIGWGEEHRLYNRESKLVGYYFWTPTWSYVYDPKMKKVGEAQCLAYQGVCAAGVAGYLLGLL